MRGAGHGVDRRDERGVVHYLVIHALLVPLVGDVADQIDLGARVVGDARGGARRQATYS